MTQLWADAWDVYQRCMSGVVEQLQRGLQVKVRHSVYTAPVVIWLMIVQRLSPRGTLATAVTALLAGAADQLLSDCERAQCKRISHRTGGYSHGRQRLPTLLCQQVLAELITRLREILDPKPGPAAYLLDGSSLELEASPSLCKLYPPAENQHGKAHWPVLRVVVMHELETGLAEQPHWGAMYGAAAVSEQELAEKAMARLPAGSMVIGDRNFGVFTIAWAAQQRGLAVVIRMTQERARKVLGEPITAEGEWLVCWKASRFDGRRQGGMPANACVEGRLIARRIGQGKSKQWLYLFTTATAAEPELVAFYGKRQHIETDLRSLKRTVRLHHISAHNQTMMEKDLLMAMAAYNLVQAVRALAARRHNLNPRQLSFTFVLDVVNAFWPKLQTTKDPAVYRQQVIVMLDTVAQGRHPKRKNPRAYPRAVWHRGHKFPAREEDRRELI
jgi:Transposase DDE domain